jgi:hypothetical protein
VVLLTYQHQEQRRWTFHIDVLCVSNILSELEGSDGLILVIDWKLRNARQRRNPVPMTGSSHWSRPPVASI